MLDEVIRGASGMSATQLRQAIEALKVLVVKALMGPDEEPTCCPHCECERIVRKGKDRREKNGEVEVTQRWRCKECGRTFTRRTFGLLTTSKLPASTWVKFVELMLTHRSVRDCAEQCGVSEHTAYWMRMRVCMVMEDATPAFTCEKGERVEVDGKYLNESLKGLGTSSEVPMPREAHRTGHDVRERGISNLKVCVVCGVSESGSAFAELCDRGRPTDDSIKGTLSDKGLEGAHVVTDALAGYGRVLPGLGVSSHEPHKAGGDALRAVNSLHKRLQDWLRPFNGVSTRRLGLYLSWFRWELAAKMAGSDLMQGMLGLVAEGTYRVHRREFYAAERPFWDFWQDKVAEVDAVSIWGEEAC